MCSSSVLLLCQHRYVVQEEFRTDPIDYSEGLEACGFKSDDPGRWTLRFEV